MVSLNTLGDIKETAQMLDTATVQWMNAGPPDSIQNKLNEARGLLQRGTELADAPLRIALVGEFNSGKTLLLNSLLDSTDLFPCLLQPTTGNVLEVRVLLRPEERGPEIKKATVSFFNRFEIENILDFYLKDLKNQGIDGLPNKVEIEEVEKLEKLLCKKFQELMSLPPKYSILSALEYFISLRANQALVWREERQTVSLPIDLIAPALTLSGRPDLNKGIQAIYSTMKQTYERPSGEGVLEKITSSNLKPVFPMMRRVMVDVSAWEVPFGIKSGDTCSTLAILDFPGLGAESSSARDTFLCMSEIRDAHCVLVMFNGSNPGGSGASAMATVFQRLGKLTSERTIIAVNRFDEFHPLPTGRTVESYYSSEEQGTTVGFSTILIPAKNLLPFGKKFKLYICSALCYLFEEKSKRPNWNFGTPKWFTDSKRQAAYTLFKRCQEDFEKLIAEVGNRPISPDHAIMKAGLEHYIDGGGIGSLRQDIVRFAMERGEKIIKEDALKEIRNAYRILDEIAPTAREAGEKGPINPEISFAAQEFYRMLELAVADTLPNGPSDYKKLKMKGGEKDIPIWEMIEQEIAANIASWPEWFAILNQTQTPSKAQKPTAASKPQKQFSRYQNLKKQGGTVPTEFRAFDERFRNTGKELTNKTLEAIGKSILTSLQRFESHPDYCDAIKHLQSMIMVDNLQSVEEALPILDVWQPSRLAEQDVLPIILERIQDEVEAIENLSYPYDGSKPCFWNLALIVRIQVQLMKTYRDRLSRLVAAAESNFQSLFCNEILRAEILPLVRSALNNPDFLGQVSSGEVGVSWENVGQVVRAAVEQVKAADGVAGAVPVSTPKHAIPESDAPEVEETPFEARKSTGKPADAKTPAGKAPAPAGKPADAKAPAGKPADATAAKSPNGKEPLKPPVVKPDFRDMSIPKTTATIPKDMPGAKPSEASGGSSEPFQYPPDLVDEEENKGNLKNDGAPKNGKKEEDDFEEW